ncbi:DsbA family protein [uncultured Paraglaciecola sp.]|uniref:DsbA family protein n=1 Tax=uncultured Paraglaciecola sp. TaxID=1765024 RepID=UPI0030DB6274|tara:strand:+ start:28638 stop:30287 length:1650 start_codon:yes stop_codon:yes gene_type:complete
MNIRVVFTLPLFYLMVACGGGGSSNNNETKEPTNNVVTAEGVFIDSPVEGLSFKSGSVEGVTDVNGTFTYEVGTEVTFSLGGIVIGSATGAAILSPLSLVADAADETDPTVVNIAAFLQTLDDDGDPENGITITSTQQAEASDLSINFQQSVFDFEFDADVQNVVSILTSITLAGPRALTSAEDALVHLRASLGIVVEEPVDEEEGEEGNEGGENEEESYGIITMSGEDTQNYGVSLDVESAVYGRDDLTGLVTSVVLTGRGITINSRDDIEPFEVVDANAGFVIVIGDTTLFDHVISMTIVDSSGEYKYVCDEFCSVVINTENQIVTFSNAVALNVDTGESLTMNGTVSWKFEEEVDETIAQEKWLENTHYKVISDKANEIKEVMEFFSFWCPHCFNFEPIIEDLKSKLPADVEFKKIHVNFMGFTSATIQDDTTKAMMVARELEKENELNQAIFSYIHESRSSITGMNDLKDLFVVNGVESAVFDEMITSIGVNSRLEMNNNIVEQYREFVSGVPNFIVNGKYQATFTSDMDQDDMIDLLIFLSNEK